MKAFALYIAGIIAITVVGVALQLSGHPRAAFLVSGPGLLLGMLFMMVVIAVIDPMNKWPNTRPFQRLAYILTFKR